MKILRFLILGLLVTVAIVCRAQITEPGWYIAPDRQLDSLPAGASVQRADPLTPGTMQPQGLLQNSYPVAETNTPDIQALADGLQDDPMRIYNYVHDHIRYVFYYGSKKGATLTLLEKSGNDFDQCALLVALLRAAGYNNAAYQFGWMGVPYDATDGTHNDLHHWLNLSLSNTNWSGNTFSYLDRLFGNRGYPFAYDMGDNNTLIFQRVWVTLPIGGTNYYLDPAFKVSEPVTNTINLVLAMGYSSNALMTAAGGTGTGNYVTSLNEANLRNALTGCTTNLLNYIQSNCPNASVEQILGGASIVPSASNSLSQTLLFNQYHFTVGSAVSQTIPWTYEPTNLMSSLTITFAGTSYQCRMPQLQGRRLSLTFDTSGLAQLWLDDALLAQNSTSGSRLTSVVLSVNHPFGSWDWTNGVVVDTGFEDQIVTNSYQRTNATYALIYAFEPDWGWLQKRQRQLDNYRQQGLPDDSRQVVSETLNVTGLGWMLQTARAEQFVAAQLGILPQFHHRLGRMAQEGGNGYYVDVYMQNSGELSNGGADPGNTRQNTHFDLWSYFSSTLENGIIEQLQTTNLVAASTVTMLELANTNGQAVYLASSTNWTTAYNVQSHLTAGSYDSGTLTTIGNYINQGYYVLLPQNGSNHIAGAGSWAGCGYEARLKTSSSDNVQMIIGGAYHGGYSAYNWLMINEAFTSLTSQSQPSTYTASPPATPQPSGADPVDMADGTFQVEHTDLSLGQAEPRGIALSRYYNGTRRYSNPAGMAGGWIHNYSVNANTVAAPQAGLGGTTPAQAAPMLVATAAAIGLYNSTQSDPKNWLVTALISKWGVDQLSKNSVSVILGKDTVQFVKQPNGVFTPPANCTMTLATNGSGYNLQQRHGNTFKFDSLGRLTNIVDQYSQPLTVSYLNSTSSLPQTVKDWKNRTLTFNYTGSQLTSVNDNSTPNRTVYYGYSTATAQGDLTSFTDPEGKISTYTYDTNHQITATLDAQSRLVVSNRYDSLGHVTVQYTQGDPNKAWRVFWSGWQNIEQDPAGSRRTFFYDDQSRVIGLQDQLGNLSQTFYDGQNHIVMTISPLNETNQFIYDGNNNLTNSIDPLGFPNQFIYDNQNNLIKAIDPRGNPSTFGYNTNFSLTGLTNGAGDWVNYVYNSDGTLYTRTDSGGTTTYGYDSTYGQLKSITYPNSLGVENFVINSQGDMTSHTDANGNPPTTFGYNNRRQLTNTVAPTNLVSTIAYDPVGNVSGITDVRSNAVSITWSATCHWLTTTLPSTPLGAPVITNAYDSRDWPTRTVDPLRNSTLYTNDLTGRLISLADPLQQTTKFGYDADGRNLTIVNAANETNSQTWDARGGLLKLTDGAGHFSLCTNDAAGNPIILTNRNGKKWQFLFDGANRLTNTLTPMGRSNSLVFNHQGLLATATDPAKQTTTNTYDGLARLITRGDKVGSTSFKYDKNNNITNVTETINSQPSAFNCSYDAYNRVSAFTNAAGYVIQYRYDAGGNLTSLIYPGNRPVTYLYDSLNRMTNVTDWSGRKTSIGYDLDSRITSIIRPNGSYRTISYDAAGQATNILEQMSNSLPIAIFKFNWTNSGSMAWEFAAPLPHTATVPTRNMTYDDDNRLLTVNGLSVTNDPDGNLTYAPLTNGVFATQTFDARNRLITVGGTSSTSPTTNTYDALNNRIGQNYGTNVTTYVVNPNANLSQVLMRIKNGVTNYYIYGPGLLYQVTETATTTNTLTYHYDFRGSTIALTAPNGIVTDRIEYSAYGLTTYRVGANDTPFLFNGRYGVMTDPNGLLYMRARFYNPYLCRFVSADPSGFSGGLNVYAFANGNPISYLDPFGLNAHTTGDSFWSWVGSGLNSIAYSAANTVNNAVYQTGNGICIVLGTAAAAQQYVLDLIGVDDPMAFGPGGGVVEEEMAGLKAVGALARGTRVTEAVAAKVVPRAYSVSFETRLAPAELGLSRFEHFQIANNALKTERAVNPALAELVPAPAGLGRPPTGWTWQHATIDQGGGSAGVLQLVPRAQHTPGSPFWSLLHPLPGGAGGYAEWAIPAGAPRN
jgi:RHS repeat-associated protein